MAVEDGTLPQMSGALPDVNIPLPNNDVEATNIQPSIDHVYTVTEASHLGSGKSGNDKERSISMGSKSHQNTQRSIEKQTKKPLEFKPKKLTRRSTTMAMTKSTKKRRKPQRKHSLDDVLRNAVNGLVFERPETRIRLPDSRDSSSIWSEESIHRDEPKSSLDIILEKGAPPRDSEADLPVSVPLPESRPESLRDQGGTSRVPPLPPSPPPVFDWQVPELPDATLPIYDYAAILVRAAEIFQHLKNGRIEMESRHPSLFSNLSYVDLPLPAYGPARSLVEGIGRGDDSDYGWNQFEILVGTVPESVNQRLVIVEDLSKDTIRFLGRHFGVSPEFFEEHLINSGYEGANYNDPPASTWSSAGMKKPHISIKWHRPVRRLPEAPYSKQELDDLLNPEVGRLGYTRPNSADLSVVETGTNIFRSEWELWTDPSTTNWKPRLCGWEERASIWVHTIANGCQIVILLLDPLPTLKEGIERHVFENVVSMESESGDMFTRQSMPTPSYDTEVDDPEAADPEAADGELQKRARHVDQPQVTPLQRIMQSIMRRRVDEKGRPVELIPVIESERPCPIIEQTAPRAEIDIGFEEAFQHQDLMDMLKSQLYDTRSTKAEYCERLFNVRDFSGFVLLQPLLELIERDATNLIKLLQSSLDQINIDILDDDKMEESLSLWRGLITRAQFELPELQRSLKSFINFMPNINTTIKTPLVSIVAAGEVEKSHSQEMTAGSKDLMNQIDKMLRRLDTVSSSITQNMSLLDSRRSIAEAEGIAKITELAFFFIPLTFAATLFGMEIEQLQTPAPLSLFVAVGIACVSASYLIRLMIRSLWIRDLRQASTASIKLYADRKHTTIQRGNITLTLFLSWLAYEMREITIASWHWMGTHFLRIIHRLWKKMRFITNSLILIGIIVSAPIAVLWTRPISHGTQTLLTVLILLIVIPTVVIIYWRNAPRKTTRPLIRSWRKFVKRSKKERSKIVAILTVLVSLAFLVVPLVVVWTQPLARGIQAAVTITVCFIAGGVLVSFLIYRLISVARSGVTVSSSSRISTSLADD